MMRSTAHWAAIALLVGLSILGLQSAIDELGSASTLDQQAATATQFGYALAGLLAAAGLLGRRAWAWAALWVWAGLITLTCGMAPVVWGGAGPYQGWLRRWQAAVLQPWCYGWAHIVTLEA